MRLIGRRRRTTERDNCMYRRLAGQIGILVGASAIGIATAYGVAHEILLLEGRRGLTRYATELMQSGVELGRETDDAIEKVAGDGFPFCSDQELAFMRDYVYNSPHVRDLGRVKDGKLYCSTGIGRLTVPRPTTKPDLVAGEMKLYARAPLMISAMSTGFIAEGYTVSSVINPESFKSLDAPPKFYSGLLYDHEGQSALPVFGHPTPLSTKEVIAGKLLERGGVFYLPGCSSHAMVCVVAAEARSAMLAQNRPLVVGFLIGGSLLGGALGLILIQSLQRQRSMENQLRKAIRKGLLTTVYQPIVSLETGAIVGAEALVRWMDEDGSQVRPDIFVALAEDRGFVGKITRLVAERVAEELGDLLAQGKLRVSLNIASQDLADPTFFSHLEGCLAAARVNPSSIGLELTERSTADQKTALHALAQFKSTGHTVYIDDFGTGYSSLAYLHELHVDAIKVDRTFTKTVGTEAVTASVVPQILEMAAQLDLLVVVEGIETNEQAEYFRAAGRGILGQGWLFGKPVPAAQFRKLLRHTREAGTSDLPNLDGAETVTASS